MKVLCFGDSITQGFWDSDGGWVSRACKYFDENVNKVGTAGYTSFFNLGIDGDSTSLIMNRLSSELAARVEPGDECTIVIQTGMNDTVFQRSEYFSDPKSYADQLITLYKLCQQYTGHIYFIGLFPVDDSKMNPMPWSKSGKCYSTERIRLFNDELESFCMQNDVRLISVWGIFKGLGVDVVLADGIHPNSKGHQLIADKVIEVLKGVSA